MARTPIKLTLAINTNTWTNMPTALTEFLGLTVHRCKVNLTDVDKVRLAARVNTAGSANAVLGIQYSLDESTWNTLGTVGDQISMNTTGTKNGGWIDLPDEAKTDVFLRLAGQGGNGTADPVIGSVILEMYTVTTFERVGLVEQLIRNIYGLVKDIRENAANYKARVTAGQPIAGIAQVMVGDANQYLIRLGWITSFFTRNQTLGDRCLGDMGLLLSQATSLRDTLIGVANHTKAASLTTDVEVNTEADFILANVPNYDRLW